MYIRLSSPSINISDFYAVKRRFQLDAEGVEYTLQVSNEDRVKCRDALRARWILRSIERCACLVKARQAFFFSQTEGQRDFSVPPGGGDFALASKAYSRKQLEYMLEDDSSYWYLYVLECEDGCYYVGTTKSVTSRFQEHQSGKGSNFTKIHKPIRVVEHWCTGETDRQKAYIVESAITIKYALEFGGEVVKGGKYLIPSKLCRKLRRIGQCARDSTKDETLPPVEPKALRNQRHRA